MRRANGSGLVGQCQVGCVSASAFTAANESTNPSCRNLFDALNSDRLSARYSSRLQQAVSDLLDDDGPPVLWISQRRRIDLGHGHGESFRNAQFGCLSGLTVLTLRHT
jgi:hypothetical protein